MRQREGARVRERDIQREREYGRERVAKGASASEKQGEGEIESDKRE